MMTSASSLSVCSGLDGYAKEAMDAAAVDMQPLFEAILMS